MTAALATSRAEIDANHFARRWFSPASYGLVNATEQVIEAHASGDLLDVGCGSMPYRPLIEQAGSTYAGLDVEARTDGVAHIGSATDMTSIEPNSFDTVLCSEVLEHIAEPSKALAEMARVIRPGGTLILTVPFLGRLHEEPHDYYRYTEHGIRALLDAAGFTIETLQITGSIFSLLGHQVSSATVVGAWRLPVVRWLALATNVVLVTAPARALDAAIGPLRRKLPLGYVVTATRNSG